MKELCTENVSDGDFDFRPCNRPAKFAVTRHGKTVCRCGIHVRRYRKFYSTPADIRELPQQRSGND